MARSHFKGAVNWVVETYITWSLSGAARKAVMTGVREPGSISPAEEVIEGGSSLFVEMAGKEPANVVSSAMAGQASADNGGGRAETKSISVALPMPVAKPVLIVNSLRHANEF